MGSLGTRWDEQAAAWTAWARAPGHDSYWQFHREAFLALVPPPGRLTVDIGCGEGRVSRDLRAAGHPEPGTKWRRVPLFLHILAARPAGAGR